MSDLSYTPTFHHTPWIDNVSRVKAGGPDGFNVRLEAIDSDLHQVSTVVATIDTLLGDVAPPAPSGTQRLLVPLDPLPRPIAGHVFAIPPVWTCDLTGAVHPQSDLATGLASAAATMNLSLPDQATLASMRIIGRYSGAVQISVGIQRDSLFSFGIPADTLVEIDIVPPGPGGNPYDISKPVDAAFAVVDNNQFGYALTFNASGVTDVDSLNVSVDSVELSYTLG